MSSETYMDVGRGAKFIGTLTVPGSTPQHLPGEGDMKDHRMTMDLDGPYAFIHLDLYPAFPRPTKAMPKATYRKIKT